MKNAIHLFTQTAAPVASDAMGTAASTDPTLLIEAQFSLDTVIPLLNFYDNGKAQDLIAILLSKAADLVMAAGGAITPDLSAAVSQAQAVVPAPSAPVDPIIQTDSNPIVIPNSPSAIEQPSAPADEQPSAPADEQPSAPADEQPSAPADEQPSAPADEQPSAPEAPTVIPGSPSAIVAGS